MNFPLFDIFTSIYVRFSLRSLRLFFLYLNILEASTHQQRIICIFQFLLKRCTKLIGQCHPFHFQRNARSNECFSAHLRNVSKRTNSVFLHFRSVRAPRATLTPRNQSLGNETFFIATFEKGTLTERYLSHREILFEIKLFSLIVFNSLQ